VSDLLQLILDVDVAYLAVQVKFNGVVLRRISQVEPVRYAARLNGWAGIGSNELRVEWQSASDAKGPARLVVTVREGKGAVTTTLSSFERPSVAPRAGAFVGQIIAPPSIGHWRWLDGASIGAFGALERAEIVERLRQVWKMLAEKDRSGLLDIQRLQITEQSEANGGNAVESLSAYASFLDERMASPDWRVEPLNDLTLHMEPMAGGRIIAVVAKDGGPAIVTHARGSMFAMSPYFSKCAGQWLIVR
jgi:hypothetical protein